MPTDWLMRRLDKLDSEAMKQRKTRISSTAPLIYLLVSSDKSPVSLALRAFYRLGRRGGHVPFLLNLWWQRMGAGMDWWYFWALRALVTLMHQAANINYRLSAPFRRFQFAVYTVLAEVHFSGGRHTERAVTAAERLFKYPCEHCKDEYFTKKILHRTGNPLSFLRSKELDCLEATAHDITTVNLDLERLQARNRKDTAFSQTRSFAHHIWVAHGFNRDFL